MKQSSLIIDENVIEFYQARGEHGFLSSLFKRHFVFEDMDFDAAEYAYQYGKFNEKIANVRDWAMQAPEPRFIAILAHGLFVYDISPGWNDKKVDRMLAIIRAKFTQNPDLAKKLLDTGDKILKEMSPNDRFWGIVRNEKTGKESGQNMLGICLMQVRSELRTKNEVNGK